MKITKYFCWWPTQVYSKFCIDDTKNITTIWLRYYYQVFLLSDKKFKNKKDAETEGMRLDLLSKIKQKK